MGVWVTVWQYSYSMTVLLVAVIGDSFWPESSFARVQLTVTITQEYYQLEFLKLNGF